MRLDRRSSPRYWWGNWGTERLCASKGIVNNGLFDSMHGPATLNLLLINTFDLLHSIISLTFSLKRSNVAWFYFFLQFLVTHSMKLVLHQYWLLEIESLYDYRGPGRYIPPGCALLTFIAILGAREAGLFNRWEKVRCKLYTKQQCLDRI